MDGYSLGRDMARLFTLVEGIMATVAELNAKVDALQVSLDTEQAQIADAIATLTQAVADLQAQVDAAAADQAQIQEVADKLDALKTDLEGTIVPPEPPVIEP